MTAGNSTNNSSFLQAMIKAYAETEAPPTEKYSPYFTRLIQIISNFPNGIELTCSIPRGSGITEFTVVLQSHLINDACENELSLKFSSNWSNDTPLTIENENDSVLDIFNLRCNNEETVSATISYEELGTTINIEKMSECKLTTPLVITFDSTIACIPLAERSPFNRAVLGFNLICSKELTLPLRLNIKRPNGLVTCFTKGNYSIAFPSRKTPDERTCSSILYPPNSTYRIKYGYLTEPKNSVLKFAKSLFLVAIACTLIWIVYSVNPVAEIPKNIKTLVSIFLMSIPAFQAFSEFAEADRHSLYSRKTNTGYAVTVLCMIILFANILVIIYGYVVSPQSNVLSFAGYSIEIGQLAGWQAISYFIACATILFLYRSGMSIKYACDNYLCQRRILLRKRVNDCYPTGRVVCKKCEREMCWKCKSSKGKLADRLCSPVEASDGYNICQGKQKD